MVLGAVVGALVGAVAGYFGGWIDEVLMRLTDLKLTIPGLILAMAVAAALGPGIVNMVVAIAHLLVAGLCAPRARRGHGQEGGDVRASPRARSAPGRRASCCATSCRTS